jgi:hypothetical protein
MRIAGDSGNVGIGATSPQQLLHLEAGDAFRLRLQRTGGNPSIGDIANLSNLLTLSQNGTGINFETGSTPTERARIDSSGRLLVGTSTIYQVITGFSAVAQQIVGGDPLAMHRYSADAGATTIWINKSRSNTIGAHTAVQNNDGLGIFNFGGSDDNSFITAARIEARVDGTPGANDMPGRLAFFTTADGESSPTERMRISNAGQLLYFSSDSNTATFFSSRAAGTTNNIFLGQHSATSTSGGGTTSILIRTNGNVVNTNNSYGAISDAKLKENIVDANSQWDDLKALQVRNYNLKEDQTHTQIGLVAQEVELVSPGLVSESPDLDENGNDLGTVTKSVSYSVLYVKAVKALQEAMERIEVLEQRLTDAGIA